MNKISLPALAAFAVMASAASQAWSADALLPPTYDDSWKITVSPYVWASGIHGESGLFGFPPQDVDMSFTDTLKNLEMVFSGVTEFRKGPFSISTDLLYARIGPKIDTPKGIAADKIDATVTTFMATALFGYSLYMNDTSAFDAVAGARLWSADNKFAFKGGVLDGTSASDSATWVDPVVGVKFKSDLNENFYLAGWGLVGGFGVSSSIMWDVMGGVGYKFNDRASMFAGYRALHDDYSHDGFVNKITQKGPILGATFTF